MKHVVVLFVAAAVLAASCSSGTTVTATTVPTTTTMPAVQDGITVVLASIDVTWSLLGTSEGWLTDPVMLDRQYFAVHRGVDNGAIEGPIEISGEQWTSHDGVTWMRAEEAERPPSASPDAPTDGAAVVVRPNPVGDASGLFVAEGLWATSDGFSWREITLRPSHDNWVPWVATGEFGWVVYSPPRQVTVWADGSLASQGPRDANLGAWYTSDTEAWFEVADLGPLALTGASIGDVGVIDVAMIVRDADILVYVYIAKNIGFGTMGNPRTEIWQLDLSPRETAEAFDFSTQDLCEWFSADDINRIVASSYTEHGATPPAEPMTRDQDMNSDCFWGGGGLVSLMVHDEQLRSEFFMPHPSLDETVRMSIFNYGSYGLTDGVEAFLVVDGHEEQLRFGHTVAYRRDIELTNTIGLTIANTMLQEMGWIDTH